MNRKRRKLRHRQTKKNPSKQWVYWIINFPFLFIIKVGISENRRTLLNRFKAIDGENFGIDIPIFFMKVYGARAIERWNKDLAGFFCPAWWRGFLRSVFRGTGHTERFLIPMAIPALIMGAFSFAVEWAIKLGVIMWGIYVMKDFPNQI